MTGIAVEILFDAIQSTFLHLRDIIFNIKLIVSLLI